MRAEHRQLPSTVRFDWALEGAAAIGGPAGGAGAVTADDPDGAVVADVAVVVDVLSFSTCVCVAADVGIAVLPYVSADDGAAGYAAERDAVLAVGRAVAAPGQVSLSPVSIRAAHGVRRLVLPSPNGSTIAAHLEHQGVTVLAGCLRNASAVAQWLTERHGADGARVAVVAAGERWPGGRLRPAVEDLWGAGAVVGALEDAGWTGISPEATAAAAAFCAVRPELAQRMAESASGAELLARGFAQDVAIAAELDTSAAVPLLGAGAFEDARP